MFLSCEEETRAQIKNQMIDNGVFIYKKDGKLGLVHLNSKELSPPIYEEISSLSEGMYAVGKIINGNLKFGYLDSLGNEMSDFIFDDAYPFKNGFAAVELNEKWAFINKSFQLISNEKFEMIKDFNEEFAEVKLENGGWSFINTKGILITKQSFEKTNKFTSGMAMIQSNGKFGFINNDGKIIIPPVFTNWREFSKHQVAVVANEKIGWKIVRKNGEIFPKDSSIIVDYPHVFDNGLFKVVKNEGNKSKYGYMNLSEEIVIPLIYDQIEGFHNHFLTGGTIDSKVYLVDEKGKELRETNYSYIQYYYDGPVAIVRGKMNDSELHTMDVEIEDTDFEIVDSYGLMGAINGKGDESIPTIYKDLSPMYSQIYDDYYNQCLFKAQKINSSLKGVISDSNEILVPFDWDNLRYVYKDAFWVSKKDENFIYRVEANKKIPLSHLKLKFKTRKNFNQNYLVVEDISKNLTGVLNIDGKWVIYPKYTDLKLGMKKNNRER